PRQPGGRPRAGAGGDLPRGHRQVERRLCRVQRRPPRRLRIRHARGAAAHPQRADEADEAARLRQGLPVRPRCRGRHRARPDRLPRRDGRARVLRPGAAGPGTEAQGETRRLARGSRAGSRRTVARRRLLDDVLFTTRSSPEWQGGATPADGSLLGRPCRQRRALRLRAGRRRGRGGPAPVLGDAGGQRAGLAGGARDRLACVATPSPRGCAPRALVDPGRRRGHTHGRARRLARLGPGADAAAARGGAGGRAARRRLGRAVVVARALRRRRRGDRERDPHPGRAAGGAVAHQPRRDPFVLGAGTRGQGGHDSRAQQHAGAAGRPARHVPRRVRGVLRRLARADAAAGGGDAAGCVRALAGGAGRARGCRARRPGGAGQGGVPAQRLRRLPRRARHRRHRQRRPRPDPRRQPARTRGRRVAQRRRVAAALDRTPARGQARGLDAALRHAAAGRGAGDRDLARGTAVSTPAHPHHDPAAGRLHRAWQAPTGWRYWSAVNNSIVGRWYTAAAIAFFLFAGVLALLMRVQLAFPGNAFLDADTYNQLFTLHGSVMMFLFAVPIFEAFSILVLPSVLGAGDRPCPRLSAFGFWCSLTGGVFVCGSVFFDAAPKDGWFMYPPLSTQYTEGYGADVWLLGLSFIEVASIAAAVELIVGVLKTRPPGMR